MEQLDIEVYEALTGAGLLWESPAKGVYTVMNKEGVAMTFKIVKTRKPLVSWRNCSGCGDPGYYDDMCVWCAEKATQVESSSSSSKK
jgi:hypothetical protein